MVWTFLCKTKPKKSEIFIGNFWISLIEASSHSLQTAREEEWGRAFVATWHKGTGFIYGNLTARSANQQNFHFVICKKIGNLFLSLKGLF